MSEEEEIVDNHHPGRMRLIISLVMLILAFVGLVISDVHQDGAWDYWRIMVPVFAVLCLFLSWYLRRKKHVITATTIWHEVVHWLGLFLAVYLVSLFVDIGIIGSFQAGLVTLILLALTTFIGGVYVEITFLVIGVALGFFALGAAYLTEYLYSIMLPITVVVALILFLLARRRKKKHHRES